MLADDLWKGQAMRDMLLMYVARKEGGCPPGRVSRPDRIHENPRAPWFFDKTRGAQNREFLCHVWLYDRKDAGARERKVIGDCTYNAESEQLVINPARSAARLAARL